MEENLSTEKKKKPWMKIVILMIVVLLVCAGLIFADMQNLKKQAMNQPTPEIVPMITASPADDWLDFKNNELRFKLKYPKEWKTEGLIDTSDAITIRFTSTRDKDFLVSFLDINIPKVQKTALKKFEATQQLEIGQTKIIEGDCRKKIADLEFNGNPAVEYLVDYPSTACPIDPKFENPEVLVRVPKAIEINKDNKIYTLSLVVSVMEDSKNDFEKITIFDQVLSTFKFLDQTATIDTSSWNTFNKYPEFSFKYPADKFNLTDRFVVEEESNWSGYNVIEIFSKEYELAAQYPRISLGALRTQKTVQEYIDSSFQKELKGWQDFKKENDAYSEAPDPKIESVTDVNNGSISAKKVLRTRTPNRPDSAETQYLFKKGDILYLLYANYGSSDLDTKEKENLDLIFSTFKLN
jgi:hypothetical protein